MSVKIGDGGCEYGAKQRFSSVAQSCPTLCDPMNHSTPGLPVHHQLPEFTQTGKFGLGIWNEAGQRLIEVCQENALVIANTLFQQHKRRLYTRTSPDGQHWNPIDYILCSQRWRSSIQSAKTRPGTDCGSDNELRITKFRLKLKKVGKTTGPLRYDLSQIVHLGHHKALSRSPCALHQTMWVKEPG